MVKRNLATAVLALALSLTHINANAQEHTPDYSGTVYVAEVNGTACYDPSPGGLVVWMELAYGTELPVFTAQPWDGYLMVDVDPVNGESCLVEPSAVSNQNPLINDGSEEPADATPISEPEPIESTPVEDVEPTLIPESTEPVGTETAATPVASINEATEGTPATATPFVTALPRAGSGVGEDKSLWVVVLGTTALAFTVPAVVIAVAASRAGAAQAAEHRKAIVRWLKQCLGLAGESLLLVLKVLVWKPIRGIAILLWKMICVIGTLLLNVALVAIDRTVPDKRPKGYRI